MASLLPRRGGIHTWIPPTLRFEHKVRNKRVGGGYYWYTVEVAPHEPGTWHKVRPTTWPRLMWAVARIRRARLGQLCLFGRIKVKRSKRVLLNGAIAPGKKNNRG